MKFNPEIHHRRSIRLDGYDYSKGGAYFITITTKDRRHIFGRVENQKMILSDQGQIAHLEWKKLPERWLHIELGAFQIMPDHMHGILILHDVRAPLAGAHLAGAHDDALSDDAIDWAPARDAPADRDTKIQWAQKPTIGQIVGAYKSLVVTECLKHLAANQPARILGKIWHRNFWENIIRDAGAFERISRYIMDNPKNWESDKFSPLE